MRRWKRALTMGNFRLGRRASCPWSATNCCCSPCSTARRRCSALTYHVPAGPEVYPPNLPKDVVA
eukprot:2331916-Pleurochrysis_carterae.AAC.1